MKKLIYLLSFSLLFANSIDKGIEAFNNKEYKKSFEIFQKLKTPKAYYYLGKQYYYGYGVKKDIKKSLEYLKKGCKLNEPKACNGLGWIYQHNKKYKNIPLAVKYFKKACNELKYGTSCNNLGVIYHRQKDYKNAVKYYKFACDLNDSWGCSNLGWHYEHSKGVGKDLDLAKEYFQKALKLSKIECNNNNSHLGSLGCNNISWLNLSGKIKNANLDKAKFYAEKAIKIDPTNDFAYNDLGVYYNKTNNSKFAFDNFSKACELNNKYGCYNLAGLYENGKGVNKNISKAIKYYKKSCDLNYAKSCDYLKSLNKNQNDYKKIYN